MTAPRVALDLAEWFDTGRAARIAGLSREQQRLVLQHVLEVSYEELGKAPRLLDDQEFSELLTRRLPARFGRRQPGLDAVPALLEAYLDHLEESAHVPHAYELRAALARHGDGFVAAVTQRGDGPTEAPSAPPVVHRAPRLGRNDPCWCASGRKFKKCHGAASPD